MLKLVFFLIGVTFLPLLLSSQVVYEPVANNPVYDLLDELATRGMIEINPVEKPYSRNFIAQKLKEAADELGIRNEELGIQLGVRSEESGIKVSTRLIKELAFYLRDYRFELGILHSNSSFLIPHSSFNLDPIGFNYSGKVFKLSVRPALDVRFMVNENGNVWNVNGGGAVFGYIGKNISYYFNVQQTWESQPLVRPEYFTMEEGKVWKQGRNGSVSNTEWRGGVSVAWKWGDFGVYKDRPIWGNGVHGTNILSGHAPSFPYIQLHLKPAKWIEFRYIHGWLKADDGWQMADGGSADSSAIRYPSSDKAPSKYIAANILTVFPWRTLAISLGNSIIYTSDHIIPAFLIPVQFFKATDQTLTSLSVYSGQNNQLFFAIDARILKMVHIYFSTYIDDIKMSALLSSDEINELGWKAGISIDRLPLRNLFFTAEYTRTNPLTYRHVVTTTEFYSGQYCLGNYMRDDSQELFLRLRYKPLARLQIDLSYLWAEHGIDYPHPERVNNYLLPFIGAVSYRKQAVETSIRMQFLNRLSGWISYAWQNLSGDVKYSPEMMRGRTNTLMVGVNLGL